MSHTTELNAVPIKDVEALRNAVARLQSEGVSCELMESARPRMYYREQEEPCDFVLKLHDASYDVGFRKQQDGSYSPIFDDYGYNNKPVKDVLGCNCGTGSEADSIGKLLQAYSGEVTRKAVTAQGYMILSETLDPVTGELHFQVQA